MNHKIIKATVFISLVILLSVFCTNKNNSTKNNISTKSLPFIHQLFVFGEVTKNQPCSMISGDSVIFGAINLTKNGNIIFNKMNQLSDTVSYFWGKYRLLDTTITFLLTDEYYYHGKWDARWDGSDPDYPKGKTRKIKSTELTLYKTKCDTFSFFLPYSDNEIKIATKRLGGEVSNGLFCQPYQETKEMKFYSWFYKQVPVLAQL